MGPSDLLPLGAASRPLAPPGLEARARAAFLRGRLRLGLVAAAQAALLPAAVLLLGRELSLPLAGGVLFALAAGTFAFHGRAPGHAVGPGSFAASMATLCPLAMRTLGHACSSAVCMNLCLPACVAGGAAAGLVIGLRARGEGDASSMLQTLLAGCLLVGLAAPMGCAVLGLTGMLAVAAGVLLGSAPALVWARG
jgi:hypothetical protein